MRLLARHDVSPWLISRTVQIDEDAIPHSHPVLTLNTEHPNDDDRVLSSFLHEEIHWFLNTRSSDSQAAIAELEALFPGAPVDPPEGAGTHFSNYLHLVVGWLELLITNA